MKSIFVPYRIQLKMTGDVQGVGLRPRLALLADQYQLAGYVVNVNDTVVLEVQGNKVAVDDFYLNLVKLTSTYEIQMYRDVVPALDTLIFKDVGFEIRASKNSGAGDTDKSFSPHLLRFPGDQAICSTCVDELFSIENRRHGYGFTSCSRCGPRYSVMTAIPYDRERTGFSKFPLCKLCQQEYDDCYDRRYHAETISCPSCGPRWELFPYKGDPLPDMGMANITAKRLLAGDIMCVHGASGFHLLANATDRQVLQTLRKRKHRPRKPFALMMKNIAMVRTYCHINDEEVTALLSSKAPLVLLKKRAKATLKHHENSLGWVVEDVAPDNPYLAVMLPSTPMQHLLFHLLEIPLVATSANRSGEPIEYEPASVKENLALVADGFLSHNLSIENPQDDTIVHFVLGRQTILRRGRGYGLAPEVTEGNDVFDGTDDGTGRVLTLSAGGHVKNTVALGMLNQVVLSPHIGDLYTLASTRRYQRVINRLCCQQSIMPTTYIRDNHPQYYSSEEAERRSGLLDSQDTVKIGHHFAHALACRFEHNVKGTALMVVWDGLGMGQSMEQGGTGAGHINELWGSEFFIDDGSGQGFPIAALLPFPLPGGDLAAKQPKRMGLSLLLTCGLPTDDFLLHKFPELTVDQQKLLLMAIEKSIQTPAVRSMGRLLDGISSLLNICQLNTFEGEAAMALQYAAERGSLVAKNTFQNEPYDFSVIKNEQEQGCQYAFTFQIDWRLMVRQVIEDKEAGTCVDVIAFRVHKTLIGMILWVLRATNDRCLIAVEEQIKSIVVSGGCFQNRLLIEILSNVCEQQEVPLHWPQRYPANDGGLALGQWVAFRRTIKEM